MSFNKVIKNHDSVKYKKYSSIIASIPNSQHGQANDAILKWCGIMSVVDELNTKPKKILDIGSGLSHLVLAVDSLLGGTVEEALCVDLEYNGCETVLKNGKCTFIKGDFFDIERVLQTNHFDLIVDACAVTHFDTMSTHANNDGCYRVGKICKRLLAKNGTLVCASDVITVDDDGVKGEYISPRSMIDSYEKSGLKLVGDYDPSREDQFIMTPHGWITSLSIAQFAFRDTV